MTKDVLPYAMVGGNPAKILKYRLPEEDIARPLALNLYPLPEETLMKPQPLLSSGDISARERGVSGYQVSQACGANK